MAEGDIKVSREDSSGNYEEVNANDYYNDGKTVIGINAQTGTTYTLALSDAGKLVRCSNSGAITVTIPKNSVTAFPTNTVITIQQVAAGVVTVAPVDEDVTLTGFGGLKTAGQYAAVQLIKIDTNTWTMIGGVE